MMIKRLMNELVKAEDVMNELDELFEMNPENGEIESRWDAQYKVVWDAREALEDEIVKITAGQITKKIAHIMVGGKRAELQALVARLA